MPIRGLAALQSLALVAALGFLSRWRLPGHDLTRGDTIYPGWLFLAIALGISMAAFAALTSGPMPRGGLAGGAAVFAAVAAGSAVVAWLQWREVFAAGGDFPGSLFDRRQDALGLATTSAVAGLAGIAALAQEGCFIRRPQRGWRLASLVLGVVLVLGLPVVVMVVAGDGRPTRAVAAALIYGLPWGVAAAAAARLRRAAAAWVLFAALAGSSLAAIGPQMTDLLDTSSEPVFAVVTALLLALLVAVFRSPAGRIGTQS
ncbi:MAG: hypothetical protein KDB63_08810 [Nocardioidaceae bacterium]|nr:hypothetical protein [Nocardioidaceae bacterium]